MELRVDPGLLRKIMELVQTNEKYNIFTDLAVIDFNDKQIHQDDVDFIIIIARSTKTDPFGIIILFNNNTGHFKTVALWPENFAISCHKNLQLLEAGIKAMA